MSKLPFENRPLPTAADVLAERQQRVAQQRHEWARSIRYAWTYEPVAKYLSIAALGILGVGLVSMAAETLSTPTSRMVIMWARSHPEAIMECSLTDLTAKGLEAVKNNGPGLSVEQTESVIDDCLLRLYKEQHSGLFFSSANAGERHNWTSRDCLRWRYSLAWRRWQHRCAEVTVEAVRADTAKRVADFRAKSPLRNGQSADIDPTENSSCNIDHENHSEPGATESGDNDPGNSGAHNNAAHDNNGNNGNGHSNQGGH